MFSAKCDIWDSETPEAWELNDGNSRRFCCTTCHTSFACLADVIKRNCRLEALKAKPPNDNEDNTDDDKSLDENVSVSLNTLDISQHDFLSTSQGDITYHNAEASVSAVQDVSPQLETTEAALRVARGEILRLTKKKKNLMDYNSHLKRKHEATSEALSSTLPSAGWCKSQRANCDQTITLWQMATIAMGLACFCIPIDGSSSYCIQMNMHMMETKT